MAETTWRILISISAGFMTRAVPEFTIGEYNVLEIQ